MELTLSASQLSRLRSEPVEGTNKILYALYLKKARQQDLADATGLGKSHISEIVGGSRPRLSLDVARKIAVAFGACIEDIFPPPCVARTPKRRRVA